MKIECSNCKFAKRLKNHRGGYTKLYLCKIENLVKEWDHVCKKHEIDKLKIKKEK